MKPYFLALLLPSLIIFNLRLTAQSKALDPSKYAALTLREKITYDLTHPESYSQMCAGLPSNDSGAWRIAGHLPSLAFGLRTWSKRQRDFFTDNRDSVLLLVKEAIGHEGAGVDLLIVIVDLNARELTPLLIDTYNRYRSNHYILTALMILMSNNKYPEFIRSPQYAQLYDPPSRFTSSDYLPYTTKNIDFILQQATSFYHATVRQ